jgi:hypothetical protein
MLSISPAIAQTFAALLLAPVLADFTFQTNWMVTHKRKPRVFILHIAVVFALTTLALGGVWQVALAVALAHLVIDAVKTWALPQPLRNGLTAYLCDQGAHVVTLAITAAWWPGAMAHGAWADWAALALPAVIVAAGVIMTVQAGGHAVDMLTAKFRDQINEGSGLPDAGRLIGQLERLMIFLLVLVGQPAGVGFLIAAKSVLRLDAAKDDRKISEYVIIGTLASFAWALATSFATLSLLEITQSKP